MPWVSRLQHDTRGTLEHQQRFLAERFSTKLSGLLADFSKRLVLTGSSSAGASARARWQGMLLASDMSAFKAANPGALLEDFVKWHSPPYWEPDTKAPMGGRLSPRIVSPSSLRGIRT